MSNYRYYGNERWCLEDDDCGGGGEEAISSAGAVWNGLRARAYPSHLRTKIQSIKLAKIKELKLVFQLVWTSDYIQIIRTDLMKR